MATLRSCLRAEKLQWVAPGCIGMAVPEFRIVGEHLIKGSRTVVDDVHAMTDERVASTVVWVRLKMRTDSFVSPALEIESAGVVERSEMPVVGGVPKIALQPVWPMPSYWIWCATGDCTEWRRFAFFGIIAAIELAVDQRATSAVVLDRGDTTSLQHPF